jgi:hypothetical protein
MGRYFFQFTGSFACEDTEGEEFPTPDAAVAAAEQVAQELAQNRAESETRGWTLRVTDTQGAEIAVVAVTDGGSRRKTARLQPAPPDLNPFLDGTPKLAA